MAKEDDSFESLTVLGDATGPLDAVDLPIVLISRDCKITRLNRAASTVLGFKASDVGSPIGSALAGVNDLDRICARVITDGAPHRIESRESDRCFLVRIAPYRGNDRQISGAVLAFTNVTAFRASIDQAIYEREYTKAILNTVIDPLVVLDTKLQVQTANRAFYTLFGLSRNDTHGVSIRKLGNSEWQNCEAWKSIEATLSDNAQFHAVEIDCDFPSIGRRTIVLNARRLTRDGSGLFLLTLQDVSERKRADEQLRRSEERFRALVTASSDMVYRMNPDWSEMRGLDGRGFMADAGRPRKDWLNEYIHPDDQPLMLKTIRQVIQTKSMFQLEHRVRRTDGTLGWTYTRAVPLLDLSGEIVEWFGAATDVTSRKEAEEDYRKLAQTLDAQVRARTRELEQRNADVLRQAGQVTDLSRRLLQTQDEERRHIARELHDSAGQTLTALGMSLAQLVQKAGRSSPELATEVANTQALVQQLHREIRTTSYLLHPPLLDENGLSSALNWYIEGLRERSDVAISLSVSEEIGRLPGDMELVVFRVVQECLTNIHRHSGSKTASIKLSRDSGAIVVEVQDSGRGIAAQKLAELQSGGSGVGIGGIRERVRQLGGEMRIDSDSSGTRVSLTVPAAKTTLQERMSAIQPLQTAV